MDGANSKTRFHERLLAGWSRTPLYLRILGAVVLGILVGLALGPWAAPLEIPAKLVLRLLSALAPVLILVAIMHALMHAKLEGHKGWRLVGLLLLNTLVAIIIGLGVANLIKPGRWASSLPPAEPAKKNAQLDPLTQFLENVLRSVLGPFGDNGNVIGVIFVAVAFGVALRRVKDEPIHNVAEVVDVALRTLVVVLHWLVDLVPLAVFGIVASILGVRGFGDFLALGAFVVTVLVGLLLQATYYLLRIKFGSWVRPWNLLRGTRDALLMAFSTGSSTATMPVTYSCLREKVGLREESASLGALVGSNFNNDGTALYEAVAALFVAQMLFAQGVGAPLVFKQQLLVVLTSIVASVGAAGIPEAGIVTMTLVFSAVGLPLDKIPILLTVDWFLDRSRTAINVMGDINVSCLLDGYEREKQNLAPIAAPPSEPQG